MKEDKNLRQHLKDLQSSSKDYVLNQIVGMLNQAAKEDFNCKRVYIDKKYAPYVKEKLEEQGLDVEYCSDTENMDIYWD
jgi:hypothetical protein